MVAYLVMGKKSHIFGNQHYVAKGSRFRSDKVTYYLQAEAFTTQTVCSTTLKVNALFVSDLSRLTPLQKKKKKREKSFWNGRLLTQTCS